MFEIDVGDKTRVTWLEGKDEEYVSDEEVNRRTSKVRVSAYIPEYLKHALAYEAQRVSAARDEYTSMSQIVTEALILYFKKRKEEIEKNGQAN